MRRLGSTLAAQNLIPYPRILQFPPTLVDELHQTLFRRTEDPETLGVFATYPIQNSNKLLELFSNKERLKTAEKSRLQIPRKPPFPLPDNRCSPKIQVRATTDDINASEK